MISKIASKGKSCLTILVAFHDGVTVLVNKGRAIGTICLDLCEALDIVLHDILDSDCIYHFPEDPWIDFIRSHGLVQLQVP